MLQLKLIFFLSLATQCIQLQGQNSLHKSNNDGKKVSFLAKIDIKQATKDGIYLENYVVNIPYKKLLTLDKKTVRIKGKVTNVKGNKNFPGEKERQGRFEDTKHILKPRIKIIE